jgi:hypothetical protein
MARRAILIGAGAAAAAARLTRFTYRARRASQASRRRLTVRATVAPELVDDLADLLRRVAGRAASDQAGSITINLAPGVSASEIEKELQAVVHRWTEMHPAIRVRVISDEEVTERRRWKRRPAAEDEHPNAVDAQGVLVAPTHRS